MNAVRGQRLAVSGPRLLSALGGYMGLAVFVMGNAKREGAATHVTVADHFAFAFWLDVDLDSLEAVGANHFDAVIHRPEGTSELREA